MVEKASPKVLVVIEADPLKSPRAVEALRIALGLGSNNEGHDLRIILAGRAPYLLGEDSSNIVDGDILEKHLPVFIEWGTNFAIAPDAETPPSWFAGVVTTRASAQEIQATFQEAERVLIF